MVAMERGKYYVSGKLTGLNRPERDFFCKTPAETRADLPKGVDVVAFQCRNPIHRAHYEVGGSRSHAGGRACRVQVLNETQSASFRHRVWVGLDEKLVPWCFVLRFCTGPRGAPFQFWCRFGF